VLRRVLVLLACAALAGCEYPRDPEGTLDRVRGGTLRVGISPSEPWVTLVENQPPAGVEVELVKEFARTVDAEVEWVKGSESDLMEALHGRQLDVVIAGLTRRSVWMNDAALTRPYLTTQSVIAAPDAATAERLSEDLEGERVSVEAHSPEAAKLEMDTDAIVVPVEKIEDAPGPVAVHDYLLDDLELVRTDVELDEHEHAMAVSMGENAMLVALERFLLDREARAGELLVREGKP
jgi:polar amino acid transport system substrate-binding protein